MNFRSPSHRLGVHRVVEPAGVLPQAAQRLDNREPAFDNELVIDVERLNIDAASFHQLMDASDGDLDVLAEKVLEIVDERGKMENPVTGSGGMLVGVVRNVGAAYARNEASTTSDVTVGDRVATLVSLTLTPLALDAVESVHPDADQLSVSGSAYLPPSAPIAVLPEDLDRNVALKAFDVCGAPAQTRRLVDGLDDPTVLVLGVGTSGMLAAAAARESIEAQGGGRIIAVDRDTYLAEALEEEGIVDVVKSADATDPMAVLDAVESVTPQGAVDLAINTCNVADTEMSTILPVRPRGTAYFFNMATDFTAATLGAEGVGRDVDLMMGNGYAEGHADYAIELLRNHPTIRTHLAEMVE